MSTQLSEQEMALKEVFQMLQEELSQTDRRACIFAFLKIKEDLRCRNHVSSFREKVLRSSLLSETRTSIFSDSLLLNSRIDRQVKIYAEILALPFTIGMCKHPNPLKHSNYYHTQLKELQVKSKNLMFAQHHLKTTFNPESTDKDPQLDSLLQVAF